MFTLWILLFFAAVYAQETTTVNPNITTLYPTNKTINKHDSDATPSKKPQTWKLEAEFAESNLTEVEAKSNSNKEENEDNSNKGEIRDFKPSPHLGSFFDEDSAEVIKTPMVAPGLKKPPSGFVSSIKDEYRPFNKIPKGFYQTHKEFPYKFEDSTYTKAKPNWHEEPMDSKPTVESPIKLPAGGLYKSPVAFKGKPFNSDEDFGLDINEEAKEHAIKNRGNPWQHLLRLVTAFIPVGLIISALTPSIVTIQNVDDNRDPAGVYRRSDAGGRRVPELAPISERCRRRLLCELHSDRHYAASSSIPRRATKHCHKLHCEDTKALWRTLRWLFTYNQLEGDQRGRQYT